MSERKIIAVTGTPGTGKSSFSKALSKELSAGLIDLNKEIEDRDIYDLDEDETHVVETEDLRQEFEEILKSENNDLVIDGLLSHLLKPNQITHIVVLRTNPQVLRKRLNSRDFSEEKISENVEAEALGVVLSEAIEIHGINKIHEIDTTENSTSKAIELFKESLQNEKDLSPGKIDWLEEFYSY
ncbi:MAG: adenylate kinase family protein [Hadesarchaea archaeon]|nr:adenylate kinase family protein [Hadesarchaea archaeon]